MQRLYPFLIAFLLFACAPSASLPSYTVISPTYYSVSQPEVSLYEAPTATVAKSTASQGNKLLVVGRQSPWYIIKREGITYYVLESALVLSDTTPANSYTPSTSSGGSTGSSHSVQTGPRGGQYYINKNGNKTYLKHK
jgi:hypothetical protein